LLDVLDDRVGNKKSTDEEEGIDSDETALDKQEERFEEDRLVS
jgi:hypothetical protein